MSPPIRLDPSVDLPAVAERFELSSGRIMNAIRQVSLAVIVQGERPITSDDLQQAIRRELAKEGKQP
jgi:hypothetical protein